MIPRFILIFYLIIHSVFAANPVVINMNSIVENIPLEAIDYFEDSAGIFSIKNVRLPEGQSKFKPLLKNIGITNSSFWLRIQFDNQSEKIQSKILELEYPPFERLEFYGNTDSALISGSAINFDKRPIKVHTHAFPFTLTKGENTIYMRIRSAAIKLPLRIYTPEAFKTHINNSFLFFAFISGIFIVIVLINIALFIKFINYTNLLYAIYASLLLLALVADSGLAFQYIWPDLPWWNARCISIITMMVLVSHIAFAILLLNLKRYSIIFYYITVSIMLLYFAIGVILLFLPNWLAFKTAIIALAMLFFLGIAAIIIAYRNGDKPVRYYMFGWISLIGIVGTSFLRYLGESPNLVGINYASSAGGLIEVIFFAIAIGIQVKQSIEQRAILKWSTQQLQPTQSEIQILSEREKQVLELISQGLTDREIATRMFLSLSTIKTHVRNLYSKLGVRNRVEAINKISPGPR